MVPAPEIWSVEDTGAGPSSAVWTRMPVSLSSAPVAVEFLKFGRNERQRSAGTGLSSLPRAQRLLVAGRDQLTGPEPPQKIPLQLAPRLITAVE